MKKARAELDPLIGPVWCSSSQAHSAGFLPLSIWTKYFGLGQVDHDKLQVTG
jgi:hypothetical protein